MHSTAIYLYQDCSRMHRVVLRGRDGNAAETANGLDFALVAVLLAPAIGEDNSTITRNAKAGFIYISAATILYPWANNLRRASVLPLILFRNVKRHMEYRPMGVRLSLSVPARCYGIGAC